MFCNFSGVNDNQKCFKFIFQEYNQSRILRIWKFLNQLPVIVQHFPIVILVVNFVHFWVLCDLHKKIRTVRAAQEKFADNVVEEYDEGRNVEKEGFSRKFNDKTKKTHRRTLKGHTTELSRLIGNQTAIISEATLSKKAEVYLEASPQAILQLYIIAISYEFSINQIATIISSVLVTTIGTMTTYLKEPTKVIYSK